MKGSMVLGGGVKVKARGPAAGKRRLPKLNGRLYVGLSIVAVFILGSLVLPLFNSADPAEQGTYLKNRSPSWLASDRRPPSGLSRRAAILGW